MEPPAAAVDALAVELLVHRVRSTRPREELAEAHVVLPAAQGARPVARRERGRLVEEEELRELARLEQRLAVPAAELEPARDPAPRRPAPADPPLVVVQAAAVPVTRA